MKKIRSNGWETSMQPVLEIAEINKKTFERLANMQNSYLTQLLEANLQQFKAMMAVQDPQSGTALQIDYINKLDNKILEIAQEEYKAVNEAREAISGVLEHSFEHHQRFLKDIYPQPDKI